MKALHQQVYLAFEASGLTVVKLAALSGLGLDPSVVSRKLRGKTPMTTVECEAFVKVLRSAVRYGHRAQREQAAAR